MRLGRDCSKAGELVEKGERPCEENEDVFVPIKYDMVGCEAAKPGRGFRRIKKKKAYNITCLAMETQGVCLFSLHSGAIYLGSYMGGCKEFLPMRLSRGGL